MIKIDQLKIDIENANDSIADAIADKLKIDKSKIIDYKILRQSIDARKKPKIFYVYSVAVTLSASDEGVILSKKRKDNNVNKYAPINYAPIHDTIKPNKRPVVIGSGPAGLFAAYSLALNGLNPIILERGQSVDVRTKDIISFWETGVLDTASNVQFGEGGAGTFSDGKLNTLVNDKVGRNHFVLGTLVKFGAPKHILYDYKPHIGTDILINVIKKMRNEIIRLGGEFHFNTRVDDFIIEGNRLICVKADNLEFESDAFVLAIGHSARDTFQRLYERKVIMQAKDFAVGFRVEHPQDMISFSMYDTSYKSLPPAPYKLTANLLNGRGVYSFCMCPGGYVVNSSSEENHLVVNGMSYSKRDGKNANSAIVVSVGEGDFDKSKPLAGLEYQRMLEKKAFMLCNGKIPQQLFIDFREKRRSTDFCDFSSETRGRADFGMVCDIFSQDINNSFVDAMGIFGTKIKGFDRDDVIISGVESRTSSPVRINRNELFQSNIAGLYPCGEGAGYAGGITSAAMDGLKVAEAILGNVENKGRDYSG